MTEWQTLKKDELIAILKEILKDHPEYLHLVRDFKKVNMEKQDPKKVMRSIEKAMANHDGSVLKAYQMYEGYKRHSENTRTLMHIAVDFAGYLFEEIGTYGGEVQEDLLDISLEVFEDACRLCVKYKQPSKLQQLYDLLGSSVYEEDLALAFYDILSYCGGYDFLENED